MNYRPPVEVCDEGVLLPNYRLLPPNFAQFIKVMDPGKNMTQLRIASTPSHTKDFGRGKQDSMSLAELFQVIDRTQEVDLHWSACRQASLTNNDKMSQEEYLTVLEDVAKTFKKLRYDQPGLQMKIKNLKKEVIPLRKVRDEIRRILTARGVTIPSGADEPLRLCENLDVLSEALEAAESVSSFSELLAYL